MSDANDLWQGGLLKGGSEQQAGATPAAAAAPMAINTRAAAAAPVVEQPPTSHSLPVSIPQQLASAYCDGSGGRPPLRYSRLLPRSSGGGGAGGASAGKDASSSPMATCSPGAASLPRHHHHHYHVVGSPAGGVGGSHSACSTSASPGGCIGGGGRNGLRVSWEDRPALLGAADAADEQSLTPPLQQHAATFSTPPPPRPLPPVVRSAPLGASLLSRSLSRIAAGVGRTGGSSSTSGAGGGLLRPVSSAASLNACGDSCGALTPPPPAPPPPFYGAAAGAGRARSYADLGTSPGALEAGFMGLDRGERHHSNSARRAASMPRPCSYSALPSPSASLSAAPLGVLATSLGGGGGSTYLGRSLASSPRSVASFGGGGGGGLSRSASAAGLMPTCLICLDALTPEDFESGEAMSLECRCKGEVALRHRRCAVKWSQVKGNTACDVCKGAIANLPPVAPREPPADGNGQLNGGGNGAGPYYWGGNDGRDGWDDEPRGAADAVFDGIRVTWVTTIVCILFFELPVARSFLAGALVGAAYTTLTAALMARAGARSRRGGGAGGGGSVAGGVEDGGGAGGGGDEQAWLLAPSGAGVGAASAAAWQPHGNASAAAVPLPAAAGAGAAAAAADTYLLPV